MILSEQEDLIMTPMPETPRELLHRREQLKTHLAAIADMRPGSLVERYRRCGKPSCHCSAQDSVGHGPCWSLTRPVSGKTVTKVIPVGAAVERTREQIAEYRRFRSLVRQLIEVSEKLCDAQIEASRVDREGAAEKGGSKRRSKRKSSRRSKNS